MTPFAIDSIHGGIDHILDACHGLEPNPMPTDDRPWIGFELGLRLWAIDLRRVLERAVTLLEEATRLGLDGGIEPLEEALGRIDQASEKLRSILVQALGIEAFVIENGSLKFRPHGQEPRRRLIERLKAIPRGQAPAIELLKRVRELDDARTARDDLAHGLAFIANTWVAPFRAVMLDENLNVIGSQYEYVPPPFAFIMPDIKAETRFGTALTIAAAGLKTLQESLDLAARVIETVGQFVPPPDVYVRVVDGGNAYSLTDPRGGDAS